MHRTLSTLVLAPALMLALSACSPYKISVREAKGIEMPGKFKFRMNYEVHDDKGKNITEEIMDKHLDQWLLFTELSGLVRAKLEDFGYQFVASPVEPVDFLVDVSFTAFYYDRVTEQDLLAMTPATLLAGTSHKDGTFTHMLVINALARAPQLSSKKMVSLWEARGIATDKNSEIRIVALSLIPEMLYRFPYAEPR